MHIMVSGGNPKGIWAMFKSSIREFLERDVFIPREGKDIVSSNAKIVLYSLFALVGLAILLYTITVISLDYNNANSDPSANVQKLQQLDQINSVYLAAISGALALGGTLIAQLWGRTKKAEGA
jgi:hypothetical protein